MKHLLWIGVLGVALQGSAQQLNMGTYGAYLDPSIYTELTLNVDHTFTYVDRFELGSTTKSSGKWKVKGKKLVLYDFDSDNTPPEWKIKQDNLCSMTATRVWEKRCLELKKEK